MCANAARCTAWYAFHRGLVQKSPFVIQASDGLHEVEVLADGVRLRMTKPKDFRTGLNIVRDPELREMGFLDTGVPHLMLCVKESVPLHALDVAGLAPFYRRHPAFPEGTNVNFFRKAGPNAIRVRTYERGVEGETLSCGTGCVASALVAGRAFGWASPIVVETRGGALNVEFDADWNRVFLIGPVRTVFDGVLHDEAWTS